MISLEFIEFLCSMLFILMYIQLMNSLQSKSNIRLFIVIE